MSLLGDNAVHANNMMECTVFGLQPMLTARGKASAPLVPVKPVNGGVASNQTLRALRTDARWGEREESRASRAGRPPAERRAAQRPCGEAELEAQGGRRVADDENALRPYAMDEADGRLDRAARLDHDGGGLRPDELGDADHRLRQRPDRRQQRDGRLRVRRIVQVDVTLQGILGSAGQAVPVVANAMDVFSGTSSAMGEHFGAKVDGPTLCGSSTRGGSSSTAISTCTRSWTPSSSSTARTRPEAHRARLRGGRPAFVGVSLTPT